MSNVRDEEHLNYKPNLHLPKPAVIMEESKKKAASSQAAYQNMPNYNGQQRNSLGGEKGISGMFKKWTFGWLQTN